ncbi:MAG: FAD-dependent monooxygenase [Kribbellaceae bacterium]
MNRRETDVLVVGAGPTGLALAGFLHAHGSRVRVVERRREGRGSRAFVMHARTLEVLAPLGVSSRLVARGDPSARARVRAGSRIVEVDLVAPGIEDTAYPFLLAIPQSVVEEELERHLDRIGFPVERGVELTALHQTGDRVRCELRGPGGRVEHVEVPYVVGCDGADSTVRRQVGVSFPGRAYRSTLLLADLDVDGELEPGTVHGFVGDPGILFLFPGPGRCPWRLLTVGGHNGTPGLTDLQAIADEFTGGSLRLRDLGWAETVRLRRGQATEYHRGRVLLAGDAAHVHSPAAAQGMNTGIQDAANLGWKLALAGAGVSADRLLSSYQLERWPVARLVRHLTDLAFMAEASGLPPLGWLRAHAAPVLLPLTGGRRLPAPAFRLLGGLSIRYRYSPLVREGTPRLGSGPHAGDRLGDAPVRYDGVPRRLHDLLRPAGHHLLLCGRTERFDPHTVSALQRASAIPLHVHRLTDRPCAGAIEDPGGRLLKRLGVDGAAAYLVRPDGYIGYRSRNIGLTALPGYLWDDRRATTGERPTGPATGPGRE